MHYLTLTGLQNINTMTVNTDTDLGSLPFFIQHSDTLDPFDDRTLQFLDQLGCSLLADHSVDSHLDIAALAFWLRKNNLNDLKSENRHLFNRYDVRTSPIGNVYHHYSSNSGNTFMYCLAISLLMGNRNLVRMSIPAPSSGTAKILSKVNELLAQKEFELFRIYINVFDCDDDDYIARHMSSVVNTIVLDDEISRTEDGLMNKKSRDTKVVFFEPKPSAIIIGCRDYTALDDQNRNKLISKLVSDIRIFSQSETIDPLTVFFLGAENEFQITNGRFRSDLSSNPDLSQTQILVHHIDSVDHLAIDEKKHWGTISFFGLELEALNQLQKMSDVLRLDRIIPVGQALLFNYVQNGYSLFDVFSKKVYLSR
jgi:hypothetical protein